MQTAGLNAGKNRAMHKVLFLKRADNLRASAKHVIYKKPGFLGRKLII